MFQVSTHSPMDSLQSQLESLYQEREELEATLGMSTASDLIAYVEDLRKSASDQAGAMIASMESQLRDLYGQKEALAAKFGTGDIDAISSMLSNLEAQLVALYEEKQNEGSTAPSERDSIEDAVAQIQRTTRALEQLYPRVEISLEGHSGATNWKITGHR